MKRLFFVATLVACADDELPVYWDTEGPELHGHSPSSTDSLLGGETLFIHGSGLSTAQTVVIGGRNAEVVSACDEEVEVILPKGTPGGGLVDITVVTDDGQSTLESCFEYASPGSDLWANEVASAALYTIRCPIEINTTTPGLLPVTLGWCGMEGGWTDGYGFDGASPQPGFAGDLMDYAGISSLPPLGESRVIGPGERIQPSPPLVYGVHPNDEAIHIVAERDFDRDFDLMDRHIEMIEENYAYELLDPHVMVWLYGEDECFTDELNVLSSDWNTLTLDGPVDGVTGIHLGFELYEVSDLDVLYTYSVPTSSAQVYGEGNVLTAEDSGVVLRYDDYSGYFFGETVGGRLLTGDVPPSARYTVSHTRLNESRQLGVVRGVESLTLLEPNLMSGVVQLRPAAEPSPDDSAHDIAEEGSLRIAWEPGNDSDEGTFIAVELIVYDATIDDPWYMTEIGRIVAQGDDSAGFIDIPSEQLMMLPEAPNRLDNNFDMTGIWAEITVARHQLRVLEMEEGDLVVDFVDAIQAPLTIYHP